jgi:ceramide glucosyltransferase
VAGAYLGVLILLTALVSGGIVYCILILFAAQSYRSQRAITSTAPVEPISVLKPLHGAELSLEENLRSFFAQTYPAYELLFAVRDPGDPAIAVVEKLQQQYPQRPARLIVTGEPPYPNAKVYNLQKMTEAAQHDLLVMADSDVRVSPHMLATIAAEFATYPDLGVSTCPYRAVPGASFWSLLEAIGMNTEFLGSALVARMLEGMKFALGPTITARRSVLEEIGGFDYLKDFLAEDFVIGRRADELGRRVIFSSYIIEHHIGSQPWRANFRHRLRWNRSTRRSRPAGYIGQVFTNPLPPALLLWALAPWLWPLVAATALVRAVAAWATAGWVLHDPLTRRHWYLLPLQDVLSMLFWLAGFFGNTITWRGRQYHLHRDGRFSPL